MENLDLKKLRNLAESVIYASTKNEAKEPARKLNFFASQMKGNLDGYLTGKLQKVVNYAIEASGQVQNKSHWIANYEEAIYILESELNQNVDQ